MQPHDSWSPAPDSAPEPLPSALTPAFVSPSPEAVPTAPSRLSTRRGIGLVLGASLLSAVVASGGTAAVLVATAPRTAPAPAPVANAASTSSQTIDSSVTSTTIESVAASVSPAVVTITSSSQGSRFDPFSIPETGVGSGFIYSSNGLILTNNHVVEGADTLTVTLNDGTDVPATVVTTDPNHDLAIVKIDRTGLPAVTLGDSSNLHVGQLLIAIGSPLGQFTDSVTSGILSATGRSIDVRDATSRQARHLSDLLQTDAAINPGNSGGPLLDASGRVIGINTAMASSAEGIGFAIPIDAAKELVNQAQASV
ncbi:MAG TPA: trypsin-like peptidase domain-containing protein [Candidatus Limnocylindrales bacterium]|nr:trypsin-like peptidase domain-containing protein [Candidatus Limnocylindrales bacterium]